MKLKIVQQEKIPSFDEVIEDPRRSSELSTGGFLLSPAIGLDYLFDLGENEKDNGGWAVGLQLGYTFAPVKDDWEVDGIEVSGGPELGITGPYIRLLIGGGG